MTLALMADEAGTHVRAVFLGLALVPFDDGLSGGVLGCGGLHRLLSLKSGPRATVGYRVPTGEVTTLTGLPATQGFNAPRAVRQQALWASQVQA